MDSSTPSKIDLRYAEEMVIFSISDCSLKKNYSFYELDKEQATKLIDRLKYFEKMTWKQLASLTREKGLTPEISGSDSFNMIHEQDSSEQNIIGEQYYFHFRVSHNDILRVCGYQRGRLFCITHIDPKGKIYH